MNSSLNCPAFNLPLSRWRTVLAAGVLGLILAACGGGDGNTVAPAGNASVGVTENTLSVSLTAGGAVGSGSVSAKAVGDNLVNLDRAWPNWSGQSTGITYDAASAVLRVPGDGSDLVLGVQRFNTPLTAGTTYILQADASNAEAAAVLFLFGTNGAIIPVPGSTGLTIAKTGSPVVFTAPANVAGFYLQVQNRYRATDQVTLTAGLIEGAAGGGGGSTTGDNLINANGVWPDWSGNATGISGANGTVKIPSPGAVAGNTIGVMRFSTTLTAGTEYELAALEPSDDGTAVLLFLFDENSQPIPFVGESMTLTWLAASMGNAKRFTAPAGVVGYAIQVQSPYRSTNATRITPVLSALGTDSDEPSITVVSTGNIDGSGFALFGDGTRQWLDWRCLSNVRNIRKPVKRIDWNEVNQLTQVEGKTTCAQIIDDLTAEAPSSGSYLTCTTISSGGRYPSESPLVEPYYMVVYESEAGYLFEEGRSDFVSLLREEDISTLDNGMLRWSTSFTTGDGTGPSSFSGSSVTFNPQTRAVSQRAESSGGSGTGLIVNSYRNCE